MSTPSDHKLFRLACSIIMTEAKNTPALNYAYSYAQAGLHLHTDEGIKLQILYILDNIKSWRGTTAKQVRAELKSLSTQFGN